MLLSYLASACDGITKREIQNAISYSNPSQLEQLAKSMLTDGGLRQLQLATAFFIGNNAR